VSVREKNASGLVLLIRFQCRDGFSARRRRTERFRSRRRVLFRLRARTRGSEKRKRKEH